MTGELLQYLKGVRGGGYALILCFLLLPYLVDVAYYGDLTPTHYAQENSNDGEKVDSSDDQASLLCADDQAYSGEAGFTIQDVGTPCNAPPRAVLPPPYLFLAALTSRPPPAL